ncbi:hypothetical protein HA466_0179960 [Hirschfeldia incana]|nr:hypothetical protein HA466_0179960 [Hirschfeldia incana]
MKSILLRSGTGKCGTLPMPEVVSELLRKTLMQVVMLLLQTQCFLKFPNVSRLPSSVALCLKMGLCVLSALVVNLLCFAFLHRSDMGCHIDGFIALVGHTHVLQEGPVTGRKADVLAAANTAAEVALRLVRPGKKNHAVTEAVQKVAEAYDCKIVEGVISHQMKQNVIDGSKRKCFAFL